MFLTSQTAVELCYRNNFEAELLGCKAGKDSKVAGKDSKVTGNVEELLD